MLQKTRATPSKQVPQGRPLVNRSTLATVTNPTQRSTPANTVNQGKTPTSGVPTSSRPVTTTTNGKTYSRSCNPYSTALYDNRNSGRESPKSSIFCDGKPKQ